MSNRTDWEALAKEILDRESYVEEDEETALRSLQERLVAELHNAFVAGAEHNQDGELVWQNECQLVLSDPYEGSKQGQMGLCHPSGEEVQVDIYSHDNSGKHEIFSKLERVPVRVTIRRVPGGNV